MPVIQIISRLAKKGNKKLFMFPVEVPLRLPFPLQAVWLAGMVVLAQGRMVTTFDILNLYYVPLGLTLNDRCML